MSIKTNQKEISLKTVTVMYTKEKSSVETVFEQLPLILVEILILMHKMYTFLFSTFSFYLSTVVTYQSSSFLI